MFHWQSSPDTRYSVSSVISSCLNRNQEVRGRIHWIRFNGIVELPKEKVEDDVEQLRLATDPDARMDKRAKESAIFGYKTHLEITKECIITVALVTTGEKNDGQQLHSLIEKRHRQVNKSRRSLAMLHNPLFRCS